MIRTLVLVASVAIVGGACSPNQRIVESNAQLTESKPDVAATPVRSTIEKDIEAMRTADFVFIYVIKRKDGGPLDNEDKKFASAVIPGEMNRRTLADDGKAILIGSNFRMPEDSRKLIEERFAVEDLSSDKTGTNTNTANR